MTGKKPVIFMGNYPLLFCHQDGSRMFLISVHPETPDETQAVSDLATRSLVCSEAYNGYTTHATPKIDTVKSENDPFRTKTSVASTKL